MCHTVSFVGTEEVEVVPAIWVKNGVCLWPPYKGEGIERAVFGANPGVFVCI